MKYRAEVDGLRAVAVLPVILFHAGFDLFSGGFVGVDVFFVISGFLITGIISEELANDRFSLLKFYERRARRILPALFLVLLLCLPVAWVTMAPTQFVDFAYAFAATGLFASNVLFALLSDYFAPASEENPLIHTWSLGVEEQFYIFFPLLLILLWRFRQSRVLIVLLVLSVASLGLTEFLYRQYENLNFYLLPTRAWELGLGAMTALWLRGRSVAGNDFLALLGLAMIAASVFLFDARTPFPSYYALLPTLGTVLIVIFCQSGSISHKVMAFKPLVWIGLISYSAYLFHQPLFAFARVIGDGHLPATLAVILIAVTFPLAWLSWRFVEQPIRRWRPRRLTPVFGPVVLASFLAALFGYGAHATNGFLSLCVFPRRRQSSSRLGSTVPSAAAATSNAATAWHRRRFASSMERMPMSPSLATAMAWNWPMNWRTRSNRRAAAFPSIQ